MKPAVPLSWDAHARNDKKDMALHSQCPHGCKILLHFNSVHFNVVERGVIINDSGSASYLGALRSLCLAPVPVPKAIAKMTDGIR